MRRDPRHHRHQTDCRLVRLSGAWRRRRQQHQQPLQLQGGTSTVAEAEGIASLRRDKRRHCIWKLVLTPLASASGYRTSQRDGSAHLLSRRISPGDRFSKLETCLGFVDLLRIGTDSKYHSRLHWWSLIHLTAAGMHRFFFSSAPEKSSFTRSTGDIPTKYFSKFRSDATFFAAVCDVMRRAT
jgi:hypothetical protein